MEQAELTDNKSVHFLSVERQEDWAKRSAGKIEEFIRAIPYKHFARKNIGYLYAIVHGAKFIFDFDDDNYINLDDAGNLVPILPNEEHVEDASVVLIGRNRFNPYPMMGASVKQSWPRGFPLEDVLDKHTRGSVAFTKHQPMEKIGVIQLCADGNPDIDAVHRLVKPLPMTFDSSKSPIVVPAHSFTPYNAQATIHTLLSFWATMLPASVPGRVTDIWRSYFAECLFRDVDLRVVFAPPAVTQVRNPHNYLGDMKAELDLYFKSGTLIDYLSGWQSPLESLPDRMEQLWIDLYERGYIELEDVTLVQLWLGALTESGYEFPNVTRRRHHNVAVMGQFNYAIPKDRVLFWHQKQREVFDKVLVTGPFN